MVVNDEYGVQGSTNGFMRTRLLASNVAIWCNCGRPSMLRNSQFQLKFSNLNHNFERVHYAQKLDVCYWAMVTNIFALKFQFYMRVARDSNCIQIFYSEFWILIQYALFDFYKQMWSLNSKLWFWIEKLEFFISL